MDINIAEYIRTLRQSRNWTLAELADKSGLSLSFLSDIERGRTLPSLTTLDKIAEAFGLTLAIRFMDGHREAYGYETIPYKKWEALKQAFYALDVDE